MSNDKQTETGSTFEAMNAAEMDGKFLTFWTDSQLYGVPIADVVQIVGVQVITEIPEFPSYAKGIINLRGSIIPLIDVRLRFGKQEIPYNERTCIIVTNIKEKEIGFIVDEVDEVTDIDNDDICPPPKIAGAENANSFLIGIAKQNGKVILLVNTGKMLSEDVLDSITGATEEL
ncbi:MAG: chemotaxis protein CheW [Oscillospiraceae bacterium]